jgi:hypothetical protein
MTMAETSRDFLLRISKLDDQQGAEKFAEALNSLKILDPKGMGERYAETKDLHNTALALYQDRRMQVSMKFYIDAVRLFVLGFRDASIFCAAQSVEQMLFRTVLKRDEIEVLLDLRRSRKLTFKWLIHGARILKPEDVALADDVMTMRDCYVHFQNQLLFSEVGTLPDLKPFRNVSAKEVDAIMDIDRKIRSTMDELYPIQERLVSKRCLGFMRTRRRRANKIALKNATKAGQLLNPDFTMREAEKSLDQDALDMLKWTLRLLNKTAYHAP